jgi:hemolysin activation/secretion protein
MVNFFLTNLGYAEPEAIKFFVKKFSIEGQSPLDVEEIESLLKPYQHQHYDLAQLQRVAKLLEDEIRNQGFSFYRVLLPPQTLTHEEIKLKIISFAVDKINISGNEYFDDKNILASVPALKSGESPDTEALANAMKITNRNPFKKMKLTFKQSKDNPDKIDANITVHEQRPYQAFLTLNNTGTEKTGAFRLTGLLQYGNLWNLDHQVNAHYSTSPDHLDTVQQYGVNYKLPIYMLNGGLSAYYNFSNVDSGTVANDFSITGSGEMYGLHYQQFLPRWKGYQHWLDVGIDNRFFVNDIKFLETPIGNSVRSVPVSVAYKGEYSSPVANVNFQAKWVGNTGLGGHNRQQHYQASRFNARQDWHLLRYGMNLSTHFHKWLLKLRLTGQYSDEPIIAGEQLGMGGSYSVRGYKERETSADKGEVVKLEFYTPRWFGSNLLAFYDYGHGRQNSVLADETKDWSLSSVGVGVRWQWKNYIFANVDFAHALEDSVQVNGTETGTNRIHANFVLHF